MGFSPKKLSFLRWFRYKYLSFIRIKDKPSNIAIGAALGISFDVLPTFGLGIVFAYFIATIMRVNRLATIIGAVVFKLAIPFFVFLNIKTGSFFIKDNESVDVDLLTKTTFDFDWSHLGCSFLAGSVINAIVIYCITYLVVYQFVTWSCAVRAQKQAKSKK